jgi:hypothetical protein
MARLRAPAVSRNQAGSAVWDVTDHWLERGPREITSISTAWGRDGETDGITVEVGEMCLWTLILSSETGSEAVITLGEAAVPKGEFVWKSDNVAVFFSTTLAAEAGVRLTDHVDVDVDVIRETARREFAQRKVRGKKWWSRVPRR